MECRIAVTAKATARTGRPVRIIRENGLSVAKSAIGTSSPANATLEYPG